MNFMIYINLHINMVYMCNKNLNFHIFSLNHLYDFRYFQNDHHI